MDEGVFFTGLSAEAVVCAHCGYCRVACPTYREVGWESCSPRGRIQITRLLSAGRRLSRQEAGRLFQCTLCGQCTQFCPTRIDLRRFWLAARAEAVERDLAPASMAVARRNLAETGNIYGYPNDERAGWTEYVDDAPPDLYRRGRAAVVYFVGCSSSFSPRVQRIAESFARILDSAGVDFTILGEGEVCCGFPLLAAGMRQPAEALVERNLSLFRATGAQAVVFTCPACRLMWLEEYARHLPGVRMAHATELLAELAAAGRLRFRETNRTVTYHDPCDLGRNGGVYEPPRRLLAAIPGLLVAEAEERRERALCCGGGGDLEMADAALVGRISARTVARLAATGADAIVTACPQCLRTLARGAEATAGGVDVVDIVELVAAALAR